MAGDGKTEDLGIDRSKSLFGRHMVALLKKRLLTFKRDKKMWAFVVLMPALFVLVGILILASVGTYSEPAIVLTPKVSDVRRVVRARVSASLVLCGARARFSLVLCLVQGGARSLRRAKCDIERRGVTSDAAVSVVWTHIDEYGFP